MKLPYLIASVVLMSPVLEAVAKDVGYYEFTDPEDSVHLIVMTIDGQKVSGSVTKLARPATIPRARAAETERKAISYHSTEQE